jgi:sigma-B regulation protein RsbQ
VRVIGQGQQVMLFAHGFGCDQHAWERLIPAFSSGYKLVLFDYVGSGKADSSAYNSLKYGSLDGYAQDVTDICQALQIQNAVFVGHSVSCMIGALVSIAHPSFFQQLIFIGPSPCYLNKLGYTGGFEPEDLDALFELMDDDYIVWAKAMAPSIMGSKNTLSLGEELGDSFCAMDPAIAKSFARVTFLSDNRADLPAIFCKNLTLQCSEDMIAPLEVGNYIHENTPNSTLVILKATGHCPHMSAPQETIDAMKFFLQ